MTEPRPGPLFTGLVLAGGRSTRMGRDKALLRGPGGETLLARAVRALREAGAAEVLVALRADQSGDPAGARVVRDGVAEHGPLAGLVAGLEAAGSGPVFALAVDLPRIDAAFIAQLVAAAPAGQGLVPRGAGGWEPLAAVYPRAALPPLRRALGSGDLSLRSAVAGLHAAGLMIVKEVPVSAQFRFENWNRPADVPGGITD